MDKSEDKKHLLPLRMSAILLVSNFSPHGTAGVRGWFDVALR